MNKYRFQLLLSFLIIVPNLSCLAPENEVLPSTPTPPSAHIISIEPSRVFEGDTVKFSGDGEASNSKIAAFRWTSALDGFLSNQASFSTALLSSGKHKIFFAVQDDDGLWSEEDTSDVYVSPRVPVPVIDFFRTDPMQIGITENATLIWHVSGASIISIDNGIGIVTDSGKINIAPRISTHFTMVASNAGGDSTAEVDVIVVPTGNMNLPVIKAFAADPGSIAPGDTATLKWNVDYADSVQIDPGIGFAEPSGSAKISPTVTTKYTLTAYNSVGIIIGTTQIVVGQVSGPGRADLVVTDIYKVVSPDGVRIGYSIENRGAQSSPETESKLYANGTYKDVISVPEIPPGRKVESRFNKWKYDPSTNIIEVVNDAENNVVENDKTNNSARIVFPVSVEYNFFENAPAAEWSNGFQKIVFGGSPDNIDGAALFRTDKRLENATGPAKYLETRPRSTYSGFITGDYHASLEVKPGSYFNGITGLLEGADAANVSFEVYAKAKGDTDWTLLGEPVNAIYDYKLRSINLPVPASFYGKTTDFRLKVYNFGEPLQNWAVWVQARIIR